MPKKKRTVPVNCLNCGKETKNPKYCCLSCSAIHTNKTYQKKNRVIHNCIICGDIVPYKRKFCDLHRFQDMTLQEAIYEKHHRSSAFALVRSRARAAVNDRPKICIACGYAKHVEVEHKKPISKFPLTTMLSEINHPNNLLIFCRNCHWEHGHGLLTL